MKMLDRQWCWAILKAYAVCLTALVGLYVVIDALSNSDEFLKRAHGALDLFQVMGQFYLVHVGEFFRRLWMLAAILALVWTQRTLAVPALRRGIGGKETEPLKELRRERMPA